MDEQPPVDPGSPLPALIQAGEPHRPTSWLLIDAIKTGDEKQAREAIHVLTVRYWSFIYKQMLKSEDCSTVAARTGRPRTQVATDATQEYVLKLQNREAWTSLAKENGGFRNWLKGSARNKLRRENRSLRQGFNRLSSTRLDGLDVTESETSVGTAGSQAPSEDEVAVSLGIWQAVYRVLAERHAGEPRLLAVLPLLLTPKAPSMDAYAEIAAKFKRTTSTIGRDRRALTHQFRIILRRHVGDIVCLSGGDFESELRNELRRIYEHLLHTDQRALVETLQEVDDAESQDVDP